MTLGDLSNEETKALGNSVIRMTLVAALMQAKENMTTKNRSLTNATSPTEPLGTAACPTNFPGPVLSLPILIALTMFARTPVAKLPKDHTGLSFGIAHTRNNWFRVFAY